MVADWRSPRTLLFRNSFSPSITSGPATAGSLEAAFVERMNRVNDSTSEPKRCTVFVGSSSSTSCLRDREPCHISRRRGRWACFIGLERVGDPHLRDISPGDEIQQRRFLALPTEAPDPLDEDEFGRLPSAPGLRLHRDRDNYGEAFHVPSSLPIADPEEFSSGITSTKPLPRTVFDIRRARTSYSGRTWSWIAGSIARCWMTEPPGGSSNRTFLGLGSLGSNVRRPARISEIWLELPVTGFWWQLTQLVAL